jgi:hypothetical protein
MVFYKVERDVGSKRRETDTMKRVSPSLIVVALGLILIGSGSLFAAMATKDILLMIDNSGSMKKHDPDFLTKDAITEFVRKLSDDTQFAVLVFDQRVDVLIPLTTVSEAVWEEILASFDRLDFEGQLTDIPAAMERGIYELRANGREGSQKAIVFVTDGIIDTGSKERDLEKTRWLRQSLIEDAAEHGIKIFGIAFTELADFELIQFLAQKTKREYFRAFTAEEVAGAFSQINQLIVEMRPAVESPGLPASSVAMNDRSILVEAPQLTEAPMPTPLPLKAEESSQLKIIILGAGVALALAGLIVLFWTRRKSPIDRSAERKRYGLDSAGPVPRAALKDMSGVTGEQVLDINSRVTRIGRLPGSPDDRINDIAIQRKTISRKHAVIEYKSHAFWIIDLGSSNGTFLNGKRVSNEMRVKHGDIISFDTYDFSFVIPDMAGGDAEADKTVFRPKGEPTQVA